MTISEAQVRKFLGLTKPKPKVTGMALSNVQSPCRICSFPTRYRYLVPGNIVVACSKLHALAKRVRRTK